MTGDISAISRLVRRARSRIRLQAALEALAYALVPATGLVVLAAITERWGPPEAAAALMMAAIAIVAVATLVGVTRPLDDEAIARRIDRASGLSDRLSSAIAFTAEQGRDGFRLLAIADGVRAAERARVAAAAPLGLPRAAGPAAIGLAFALVLDFTLPTPRDVVPSLVAAVPQTAAPIFEEPQPEWDCSFPIRRAEHLQTLALRDGNPFVAELAESLVAQLRRLERGEITKEELLAGLAREEAGIETVRGHPEATETLEELDLVIEAIRRLRHEASRKQSLAHIRERPLRAPHDDDRGFADQESPEDPPPSPDSDGIGHDTSLAGSPQQSDMPTRDLALGGTTAGAGTQRMAVLAAARRGFASTEYQHVYVDYQKHNGETMHDAALPTAYRYYVKRYFDVIRPKQ